MSSPILFSINMAKLIKTLRKVTLDVKLQTNTLEFSATQTISHYYALLFRDKCYYCVIRMHRNIIYILIRRGVN